MTSQDGLASNLARQSNVVNDLTNVARNIDNAFIGNRFHAAPDLRVGLVIATETAVPRAAWRQRLLGTALMAVKGYGALETGAAYDRARELCGLVDRSADLGPVLLGVWLFNLTRANHMVAREVAEEILSRAASTDDPGALMAGNLAAGISEFHVGALAPAARHLDQMMVLRETHRPTMQSYQLWY